MREKWFIKNTKGDFDAISRNCQVSPVLARLLVSRGIRSGAELKAYLHPSLHELHDPFLMKDMDKVCEILMRKIKEGKAIRIIGDYDVDGVMSTYILYQGLRSLHARVDYEIPDRMKDGYGININIVKRAKEEGIDTILTCDNGIAAREQIAYARNEGMTVIVTDHHDIPMEHGIPDADAVVDPKRPDCSYPYSGICGAVIAMKCMQAIDQKLSCGTDAAERFVAYAAIATVCDVMNLEDENRIIVKIGLSAMEKTDNIGLQALLKACGLWGTPLSAYHLGFVVGPCINASGRLETAKKALSLFLMEQEEGAAAIAKELKELNEERKSMTSEGLLEAVKLVESGVGREDKVLLVFLPDCHESLAGIIAGRLRERYYKPTLVFTKAEDGIKGSGRSIPGYSMFEEISRCEELLSKFGGHPMAAGLSLPEANLAELGRRLNEQTLLTEEDLVPKVTFDMELSFDKIDLPFIHELKLLEPYGNGNAKPLFAARNVQIESLRRIGKNQDMFRMSVRMESGTQRHTALLFQNADGFTACMEERFGEGAVEAALSGDGKLSADFLYYADINEYRGMQSVQFIIQHFR